MNINDLGNCYREPIHTAELIHHNGSYCDLRTMLEELIEICPLNQCLLETAIERHCYPQEPISGKEIPFIVSVDPIDMEVYIARKGGKKLDFLIFRLHKIPKDKK